MTPSQLQTLIESREIFKMKGIFESNAIVKNQYDGTEFIDPLTQYDPKKHAVHDKTKRKDREVMRDSDTLDAAGNKTKVLDHTIPVTRTSLPLQKRIVLTQAAFLGTPKMKSTPAEGDTKQEDLAKVLQKIWDDNKLDYKFKNIAKRAMSERHVAVLWYTLDADPDYWTGSPIKPSEQKKFRMKILSPSTGDSLYPVFDDFGDMIAFGRGYKIKNEDNQEIEYFDLYTADRFYYARQEGSVWQFNNGINDTWSADLVFFSNVVGKIPVAYFPHPITAWEDVQELIERVETTVSNLPDINDYSGSPILFGEGDIEGMAEKGETGKFFIGKQGAKLSYVTYPNAPESIKLEIELYLDQIFAGSHTPNISFEKLQGLGYFSTVALQTLFMDAHFKAADEEEIFGEGLQRMINYLKKAVSVLDKSFVAAIILEIKPHFEYFIPKNLLEMITMMNSAVTGGLLSQETAVGMTGLVEDAPTELERIQAEKAAADKLAMAKLLASNKNNNLPKPSNGVPAN